MEAKVSVWVGDSMISSLAPRGVIRSNMPIPSRTELPLDTKVGIAFRYHPDGPPGAVGVGSVLSVGGDLGAGQVLRSRAVGTLALGDGLGRRTDENPTAARRVLSQFVHVAAVYSFTWLLSFRRCCRATSTQSFSEGSCEASAMYFSHCTIASFGSTFSYTRARL